MSMVTPAIGVRVWPETNEPTELHLDVFRPGSQDHLTFRCCSRGTADQVIAMLERTRDQVWPLEETASQALGNEGWVVARSLHEK